MLHFYQNIIINIVYSIHEHHFYLAIIAALRSLDIVEELREFIFEPEDRRSIRYKKRNKNLMVRSYYIM